MATLENTIQLLQTIPENKLDLVYTFLQFVKYQEKNDINNSLLSEPSLAKDWLRKEEDAAWENL